MKREHWVVVGIVLGTLLVVNTVANRFSAVPGVGFIAGAVKNGL
jgi:hypothetical protein